MSEEEKKRFFADFESFLQKDIAIKKILMELAQAKDNLTGTYQMQRYVNLLRKTANSLEETFKNMIPLLKGIPSNLMEDFIKKFFAQIQIDIANCDCTAPGIQELFTTRFSEQKESFLNAVNQNCIACYTWFDLRSITKECTSINELLHFYHSYIINNLNYEEVFPLNTEQNQVFLFGTPNEMTTQLLENFPSTIDSGFVYILSCSNDLAFMIIRDYGHATSIKISKTPDGLVFDYFIPKVINPDKVRKLPGFSTLNLNNRLGWATGNFRGTISDLFEFIEKIPTDQDIERQI